MHFDLRHSVSQPKGEQKSGKTIRIKMVFDALSVRHPNTLSLAAKKGKPHDPTRVQECRAKPDGWFEYTKVVLREFCVTLSSDFAVCHTCCVGVLRVVHVPVVCLPFRLWGYIYRATRAARFSHSAEAIVDMVGG